MCSVCPRLALNAPRQSQDSSYLLLFFNISFVNVKEVVSPEPQVWLILHSLVHERSELCRLKGYPATGNLVQPPSLLTQMWSCFGWHQARLCPRRALAVVKAEILAMGRLQDLQIWWKAKSFACLIPGCCCWAGIPKESRHGNRQEFTDTRSRAGVFGGGRRAGVCHRPCIVVPLPWVR